MPVPSRITQNLVELLVLPMSMYLASSKWKPGVQSIPLGLHTLFRRAMVPTNRNIAYFTTIISFECFTINIVWTKRNIHCKFLSLSFKDTEGVGFFTKKIKNLKFYFNLKFENFSKKIEFVLKKNKSMKIQSRLQKSL